VGIISKRIESAWLNVAVAELCSGCREFGVSAVSGAGNLGWNHFWVQALLGAGTLARRNFWVQGIWGAWTLGGGKALG